MCGIAGFIYADRQRPVDPDTLVAMAAIQYHRGPDGFGWQAMDGVGFSHARLSIIDLDQDRGRQPFVSADKRLMITKNGELYDYQRIRATLSAEGARFLTKSDSEIVMHLYPRLGLDGTLPHLRGEFAFALFDRAGILHAHARIGRGDDRKNAGRDFAGGIVDAAPAAEHPPVLLGNQDLVQIDHIRNGYTTPRHRQQILNDRRGFLTRIANGANRIP